VNDNDDDMEKNVGSNEEGTDSTNPNTP